MSNITLPDDRLGRATEDAYMEVRRAKQIHGNGKDFASFHEGYGVLLEEQEFKK